MEEKTIIEEALYEFDRYVEDTISNCTDDLPTAPDNSHAYDWTMGFIKDCGLQENILDCIFKRKRNSVSK